METGLDKQAQKETEQESPENEQITSVPQKEGPEKQAQANNEPRVEKRNRGRPRKTRVVVKRAVSSKFD